MPEIRLGGTVIELVEPSKLEAADYPLPEPASGEVVVNMRALGICGTDLHMFDGRATSYPHVVGHDGAGVVTAIGTDVDNVVLGQRVTIDPVMHCGKCLDCSRGAVQLCATGGYLGMLGPGLLGQYVCVPANLLVALPDNVSDLAATVLEPLTVALHLLARVQPLLPDPVPCAVIGGGPLGILLAAVLRHHGYEPHVLEPQESRRVLGEQLGLAMHPPELIDIGNGPRLVVETSAVAAGVALADQFATPGSVVAVVGRAPESIAPPSVLLKELSLLGVKGGAGQYAGAVQLVADGVVDPTAVITHRYAWNEAGNAFATNLARPDLVTRAVLHGEW